MADESQEREVGVTITKLGGSRVEVKVRLSTTVQGFKDSLRTREVVVGLFSYKLITDAAEILKDETKQLSEYGVQEGSNLTLIMGRTRDYSKISQFDKVLKDCNYPQGIIINDSGEMLVCTFGGKLLVYNAQYKLIREHCLPCSPPTQMAFAPSGELLISFTHRPVGVFDRSSMKMLRTLGKPCSSNGIAVSGDRVFVSDARDDCVFVYDFKSGDLLNRWTGFCHPCGLAVLDDSRIAVADRRNHKVQLRDLDGNHLSDVGVGELKNPNDVVIDPDGNLLILDTSNTTIAVYGVDGVRIANVMPGFFRDLGNTYSYLAINQVTGAVAASFDDEHKVVVLAPLFPLRDEA